MEPNKPDVQRVRDAIAADRRVVIQNDAVTVYDKNQRASFALTIEPEQARELRKLRGSKRSAPT